MVLFIQSSLFVIGLMIIGIAFIKKLKSKYDLQIALVILGGFLLRLMVSLDPCLHEWDEKFHALVAKNLQFNFLRPLLYKDAVLEYSYQNWTGNAIWLHKQPMGLWLISLSVKLFGEHALSIRIPSLLIGTASIYLTYQIGKKLFTREVALLASALLSMNGFIIEIAGGRIATDHIDTIFFFFILLGIHLTINFKPQVEVSPNHFLYSLVVGFVTGLAILTKWLPGLIIFPIFLYWNRSRPHLISKSLIFLMTACIVFLPWQFYASLKYPNEYWYEFSLNSKHLTDIIEGHQHSWFYFLNQARINWNELIYIPLIWLIYEFVIKRNKNESLVFLAIWIGIPYFIFSIAKTKMAGYVLFTGPAFFLTLSYFTLKVIPGYNVKISRVFLIAVILLSIRYCFERTKPFRKDYACIESAHQINDLDQFIKLSVKDQKAVVLNHSQSIEIMYFTDHIAYAQIPTREEIDHLVKSNYAVILVNGNNTEKLKDIPGIILYHGQ